MKCRKCEIYFASKPEILCMSNLGDAMFSMKDTKNLKKKLKQKNFKLISGMPMSYFYKNPQFYIWYSKRVFQIEELSAICLNIDLKSL